MPSPPRTPDPHRASRSTAAALSGLFLAALTLRPQIVGVGPLIHEIQDDFDASHALVGLIGTIPVLCMGLFAPVAAYLSARLGTRKAMTIGLRADRRLRSSPGVRAERVLVVLLTWGWDRDGPRERARAARREGAVPDRPATGTGVYTTGIQIGSTVAAALAVPLARPSRRLALGARRAVPVGVRHRRRVGLLERGGPEHARPGVARSAVSLEVADGMAAGRDLRLDGSGYYGLNAWLPDAYIERGWSDESAGALLAAMNLTAIPSSFVIPWLSDRYGGRQPWLVGLSCVFAIGRRRARRRPELRRTSGRSSRGSPRAACSRS